MLVSISFVSSYDFSISFRVISWDASSPSQHSSFHPDQQYKVPYISSMSEIAIWVSQISGYNQFFRWAIKPHKKRISCPSLQSFGDYLLTHDDHAQPLRMCSSEQKTFGKPAQNDEWETTCCVWKRKWFPRGLSKLDSSPILWYSCYILYGVRSMQDLLCGKVSDSFWGKSKVLLIGNCDAGKTSMRSIIFANYEGKSWVVRNHE